MIELNLKTYDELTALAANILATWMSGDHVIDCLNQEKFEIEAADHDQAMFASKERSFKVIVYRNCKWATIFSGHLEKGFGDWLELCQLLRPEYRGF